jgi:hypothetical protein
MESMWSSISRARWLATENVSCSWPKIRPNIVPAVSMSTMQNPCRTQEGLILEARNNKGANNTRILTEHVCDKIQKCLKHCSRQHHWVLHKLACAYPRLAPARVLKSFLFSCNCQHRSIAPEISHELLIDQNIRTRSRSKLEHEPPKRCAADTTTRPKYASPSLVGEGGHTLLLQGGRRGFDPLQIRRTKHAFFAPLAM